MRIPGEIDLTVYGDPELVAEIARSQWRLPTDEETKTGLAELEKLIGPKLAKAPGWLRRLCIIKASGAVGCVVTHVRQAMHPEAPWRDSDDVHPVPIALPLASAVALLASAANPETELARRQRLVDEFYAAQEAKQKENRARQEAEAAAVRRTNKERLDFKATEWAALNPLQRFGARLALTVQGRDPALAADIRAVMSIEAADPKGVLFPRGQWWEGIADDAA
jgi:hypothetical protein